jgi:hypothetical protein
MTFEVTAAAKPAPRPDRRPTPTQVSIAVLGVAVAIFWYIGRNQWFIRDDWAFVLTRRAMREQLGVGDWLFTAQDGHWMTPPLLVYWLIEQVFGIDSYWPFLLANMALHVGAVLLVRELCRRVGVSEWTTVLVCTLLLLFGSGWENVVFAVQVTYNLSLVAFLAHLVLVDHEGPVGRRDVAGAAVGIVGVSSSAFGPFFAAGVFAVLCWRRRWRAAAVAVAPQAVLYSWWLFTWGSDPAGNEGDATVTGALKFARLALTATFNGMTGQILFAGVALFGIVVVVFLTPMSVRARSMVTVLAVLPLPVLLAIGWQRAVFGLDSAASPRYQYMTAMVLAVPFALAIDQLRRLDRRALVVGWAVVGLAVLSNVRLLVNASDDWADRSADARRTFELVAGSPEAAAATVDPNLVMVAFDPDVTVGWLPVLVDEGAITPRTPTTPEELALVQAILAGTPRP